jgi:hypothetical protein
MFQANLKLLERFQDSNLKLLERFQDSNLKLLTKKVEIENSISKRKAELQTLKLVHKYLIDSFYEETKNIINKLNIDVERTEENIHDLETKRTFILDVIREYKIYTEDVSRTGLSFSFHSYLFLHTSFF